MADFLEPNYVYALRHVFAKLFIGAFSSLEQAFLHLTQPARYSIVCNTAGYVTHSQAETIALVQQVAPENRR